MNEVSAGQTPTQRWASLGGHTGPQAKPLSAVCGCIVSEPKKGKTTLFEGNPDAFILNLDGSSTVNPCAVATKWPPLNEDGTLATSITWEHVDEIIEKLVRMAQSKQERPTTIVIDSLSSMLELVIDYVTRNAKKLKLVGEDREDPEHFGAMNGQAAWDVVYNTITQTIQKLRNTGYGVWILGHILNKTLILSSDSMTVPQLTITEGFWKRLHPRFDFIGLIMTKSEAQFEEKVDPRRPGKSRSVKVGDKINRVITIDYPALKSVLGARVPFEETVLSLDEGWDQFAAAYEAARSKLVLGASHGS